MSKYRLPSDTYNRMKEYKQVSQDELLQMLDDLDKTPPEIISSQHPIEIAELPMMTSGKENE